VSVAVPGIGFSRKVEVDDDGAGEVFRNGEVHMARHTLSCPRYNKIKQYTRGTNRERYRDREIERERERVRQEGGDNRRERRVLLNQKARMIEREREREA
jgi:hypothetical protein